MKMLPQLVEWFCTGEKKYSCKMGQHDIPLNQLRNFLFQWNIPLLDWPGNSPDLNSIENVWKLLKKEIAKQYVTNKVDLIEKIIYHWKQEFPKNN